MQVSKKGRNPQQAFTMVEIALSIAVVAFALVAILGVLPTGMTVQKDNRDDGIINQEGRYWLEAIRSGARGLEDLTNYIEAITITNLTTRKSITIGNVPGDSGYNTAGDPMKAVDVIALLSTPKYFNLSSGRETNRVSARVKAMTGPAAEKGPLTNEFSFRYEMQVEITPVYPGVRSTNDVPLALALSRNLHDIRLVFRWPVVQRGSGWFVGGSRKTFRGRIAGRYELEPSVTRTISDKVQSQLGTNLVVLVPNKFDSQLNATP